MQAPGPRDNHQAQTRLVLDAVSIAVIVTDPDGVVTAWNHASEALFGWASEEAVGESITDLIVPAYDVAEAAGILAYVTQGAERSGEFECCRKDGTQLWASSTLTPIYEDGRVVGMVGTSVDISERRAAAIRVGSMLRHTSDVAFIVNVDGTFKHVSPMFERAFGFKPGELVGELGYDFVHPDDRPRVEGLIAEAVADPSAHPVVVYRGRTEDGSWQWREIVASNMLDEPAVAGIVVNVRDVSEREEAIAALQHSEARFRSLFEHANDVGFLTDVTGRIVYVTPSILDVLGYRPQDVVREGAWNMFSIEVEGTSVAELVAGLADPGSRVDFAATLAAADGSSRWVEMTVRNLSDDPAVNGFVTNLRDVTERMETLLALRTSEGQLRAVVARSNELTIFFAGDGTVVWMSPAAAEIFDVAPEALIGSIGFDMIHPDDRERVLAEFMTMTSVGDHLRTQFRTLDFNGRVRWVDEVATNLLDDPDVGYVVANMRDVTEQHDVLDALAVSEAQYRSIVETAQEGIWVTALDGSTTFVNSTMAEMLGSSSDALSGRPIREFLAPGNHQAVDALEQVGSEGTPARYEVRFRRENGCPLWAIVSTSPLRDADNLLAGALHMVTDITDRKQMEEELARLALHDPLTGLPNRQLLVNRLEHMLSRQSSRATAVIYLDLDNFKDLNDSFGPEAGDDVLREVGARLRAAARPGDTVARFGGDEFVVLCDEVVDASEAVGLAEVLHAAIRAPLAIGASEVVVSASFGIALAPPADGSAVLRCADTAMYRAKKLGRARISLFENAPGRQGQDRVHTQFELIRALAEDELIVYYQPIVELARGTVVGVEALVRWQHPERGLISPDDFIPAAEASGLVREIGWRVLETATRDASHWFTDANPIHLSVNLAAAQIADDQLVPRVKRALRSAGLPASALTMEITESAAMHDEAASDRQLKGLRDLGVHLSLDDFGTGYSSLSLLRRLPINAIKIDRSFVSGLGTSRDDALIVGGVISMARAMGHAVVAEGIETEAQREEVSRLGCPYGQGYLFSRPVPLEQLQDAIDNINRPIGHTDRVAPLNPGVDRAR